MGQDPEQLVEGLLGNVSRRVRVWQAQGVLMEVLQVAPQGAQQWLLRRAEAKHTSIFEVATQVVADPGHASIGSLE
jgi:AmiR/NasT family two-component response regulator